MTGTRPAKPWRVQRVGSTHQDYPSQPKAYEAVASLISLGFYVKVWHWQDGSWRLCEAIDPPGAEETTMRRAR